MLVPVTQLPLWLVHYTSHMVSLRDQECTLQRVGDLHTECVVPQSWPTCGMTLSLLPNQQTNATFHPARYEALNEAVSKFAWIIQQLACGKDFSHFQRTDG